MSTGHVTRVVLDRYVTPPLHELTATQNITARPGHPQWRVSWTITGPSGGDYSQSHDTPTAARRHATNLLKRRPPDTAAEDIYRDAV